MDFDVSLKNMPDSQKIEPHRVTKPIQLLAAWLVGLILVDTSFLVGAGTITEPSWVPALLAIAAVVNVPLFIVALFLLQTRFRPEMQEDTFYSAYLETKTAGTKITVKENLVDSVNAKLSESQLRTEESLEEIRALLDTDSTSQTPRIDKIADQIAELSEKVQATGGLISKVASWSGKSVAVNKMLSDEFIQNLKDENIPINDKFGTGIPKESVIAIGDGFSLEQITSVLRCAPGSDWWVVFAAADEELGEYKNTILIGSYLRRGGIRVTKALNYLSGEDAELDEFYDMIGWVDETEG